MDIFYLSGQILEGLIVIFFQGQINII